ncbi:MULTISPECIES: ATP-binding protein [Nocardiopsis]|uniref:Tetratricopeptide repeat protein n=1 Tax=Nocardiopsis changdeensis TaxID=2831969 RepID=A0ABX8BV11_9ACTN|nr:MULTISPECIES: tetratricopeptide repeat protein [Nocardiopsis]QUX24937.1 tetratricopeptide repeat protein [Nocardiopsis changdeensis]QYX35323.1 tetratricopeptide repeat protein [Nocardiopsis sp. MT53]
MQNRAEHAPSQVLDIEQGQTGQVHHRHVILRHRHLPKSSCTSTSIPSQEKYSQMPADNFSQGDRNTIIQARSIHGGVLLASGSGQSTSGGLPSSTPVFTGRTEEIEALTAAAAASEDSGTTIIHTIDGMAGVGKTAFALRVARLLKDRFPDGALYAQLHGHSPERRPAEPGDALLSLLVGAGIPLEQIPEDVEARSALWRRRTEGKRMLVILDDAAGSAQVRPLVPGEGGSLVLVTSRIRMSGLAGATPLTLSPLSAKEAALLFTGLSRRADTEEAEDVDELVHLCGHLPLAVGIMAGRLAHRPSWRVRDLVDDLVSAKNRVRAIRTEDVSVAAALDLSFDSLPGDVQRFLLLLSFHPCSEFDVHSAAAATGLDPDTARNNLSTLYDRHLILEATRERYNFHDLISEHLKIRALNSLSSASRQQTIKRTLDYFLATAHAADAILYEGRSISPLPGVVLAETLSEFISPGQARSWLRSELENLRTATRRAIEQNLNDHALGLPRVLSFFLWQEGFLGVDRELQEIAVLAAERLGNELALGNALTALGRVQTSLGYTEAGDADQRRAHTIFKSLGNPRGIANTLMQRGLNERMRGRFSRALDYLNQAKEGYERIGDIGKSAKTINHIGVVQRRSGLFPDAVKSHEKALFLFRSLSDRLGIAISLNYLGGARTDILGYQDSILELQEAREIYAELGNHREFVNTVRSIGEVKYLTEDYPGAIADLSWSLQEYRELGNRLGEANALHYLGSVKCDTGDFLSGTTDLRESANIFEDLQAVSGMACALSKLGILHETSGEYDEAISVLSATFNIFNERISPQREAETRAALGSAQAALGDHASALENLEHALSITRRIGSRREEARFLYRLGRVHLGSGDVPCARQAFDGALTTAVEHSLPLEKSLALEGLGRCLHEEGRTTEAREHLERALTHLSSIGSVHASRVEAALSMGEGSSD